MPATKWAILRLPNLPNILLAAILTVMAAVVFDRMLEFGLRQVLLQSHYRYLRVYAGGPPARFLVLGNSRAGTAFPHGATGEGTFFNLGNGGMGVPYSAALTRDYIDYHGAPKAVIIEMWFVVNSSGADAAGLTRVFSERARAIDGKGSWFEESAERVFHLIRFNHATLLNGLVGLVWEREERAVSTRVNDAAIERVKQSASHEMTAARQNVDALGRLIADLRQQGIVVICVLNPILKEMREKIANRADFIASLRTLAESNGAEFLDDSELVSDRALFADVAHLNVDGVKQFQQTFFREIEGVLSTVAR